MGQWDPHSLLGEGKWGNLSVASPDMLVSTQQAVGSLRELDRGVDRRCVFQRRRHDAGMWGPHAAPGLSGTQFQDPLDVFDYLYSFF